MKKELEICCPFCNFMYRVNYFSSYNVQEEKNIDSIVDDSWITHECPKCHKAIKVVDEMIFHDAKRKLMIYFFPKNTGTIENHVQFVSNFNYPQGYTIRIVEKNYNDFKEKILILENDMDDKAIELYKLNIILEKYNIDDICEAHVLFDNDSVPKGFVFKLNNGLPSFEKIDLNEYKLLISNDDNGKNYYIHFLNIEKEKL